MYANWAGLIVDTNFHFGSLSFWPDEKQDGGGGGVYCIREASTALLFSDRPQDNELCRASRPCWEQQKPAKHKGNAQRPRIPWDTPSLSPANPCAPLEARRQQPSEEAHRGGGGGAKEADRGGKRGPAAPCYNKTILGSKQPTSRINFMMDTHI